MEPTGEQLGLESLPSVSRLGRLVLKPGFPLVPRKSGSTAEVSTRVIQLPSVEAESLVESVIQQATWQVARRLVAS